MNTDYLVSFVKVVEAGSFSKAAEETYISSPGLQQRIRKLEEEMGVKLFDRGPGGVACTGAGLTLYKAARPLIGGIESVVEDVKRSFGSFETVLRFGMGKNLVAQCLLKICHEYHKANPDVEQRFVPCEFEQWTNDLVAGLFDICEFHGEVDEVGCTGDVKLDVIAYEPLYACVFPDDVLARERSIGAAALRGRCVHLPQTAWAAHTAEELATKGVQVDKGRVYQSALRRFEAAVAGCVNIVMESWIPLYSPLVGVRVSDLGEAPFSLAYRKDCPPLVKEFVSFAKGRCMAP